MINHLTRGEGGIPIYDPGARPLIHSGVRGTLVDASATYLKHKRNLEHPGNVLRITNGLQLQFIDCSQCHLIFHINNEIG